MSTRGMYLIGMLVLLFLANLAMLMGMTNWPARMREGFADAVAAAPKRMSGSAPVSAGPEAFTDYLTGGGFGTGGHRPAHRRRHGKNPHQKPPPRGART